MAVDFGATYNSSRYYDITLGAGGLALPDSDWAVGMWLRIPHGMNTAADFQYIFSGGTIGANNSFHLFLGDSTNLGELVLRARGAAGTEIDWTMVSGIGSAPDYILDEWRLIVVQRNSASSQLEAFWVALNGSVSGPTSTTALLGNTSITPASWNFGRRPDGSTTRYFQNVAAELFVIVDGKLSNTEIQQLAAGAKITDVYSGSVALYQRFLGTPSPKRVSLAADDFERADANPVSGNWTTAGTFGALQILSGALAGVTNSNRASYYSGLTWRARQWAEAIYSVVGTGEGGPGVRLGTSSVTAYRVDCPSGSVRLAKHVGNAYTALQSWTRTVAVGDSLRIEVDGTTISAYHNNVLVGSVVDTSLATGNAGAVIWNQSQLASWSGGFIFDELDLALDHHADAAGTGFALASHPFIDNLALQLETLDLTDASTALAVMAAAAAEAITVMDSCDAVVISAADIGEAVSLLDVQSAAAVLSANVAETITVTDQSTTGAVVVAAISELLNLLDSSSATSIIQASVNEAVAVSDAASADAVYWVVAIESVNVSDLATASAAVSAAVVEAIAPTDASDSVSGNFVSVSETISLSDSSATTVSAFAIMQESISVADTADYLEAVEAAITETLALVDTSSATNFYIWAIPASSRLARVLPIPRIARVVKKRWT